MLYIYLAGGKCVASASIDAVTTHLERIKEEAGNKRVLTITLIHMAVQTEIYLSGKLNNLVFYKSGGQNLVRTMPASVMQSTNTKIRSRNFGLAAAAGKVLRSHLAPVLPFPKDKKIQSLFSGAIARWLGLADAAALPPQQPIAALVGFSFNTSIVFTDRCKIPFTVSSNYLNEVQLHLPAFIPAEVFAAPTATKQIELSFSLACCGLLQADDRKGYTKKLTMPYDNQLQPAQTLLLPADMQQGTFAVLAAAIHFMNEQEQADGRAEFLPAGLLWAGYY